MNQREELKQAIDRMTPEQYEQFISQALPLLPPEAFEFLRQKGYR